MKKTLVSALTTALVVGAASTTFAAANPFADVPADHWAYDAVSELTSKGVVNGFPDGTFRGNQNMTRYEMAQIVAKAMAKVNTPGVATSGTDKAMVDKLAAEFKDELANLGVRVDELESRMDNVKWSGWVRYEYKNRRQDSKISTVQRIKLRLTPSMKVNKQWTAHARMEYGMDANAAHNSTAAQWAGGYNGTQFRVDQAWVDGKVGKATVKLGRFGTFGTAGHGIAMDDVITGAQVNIPFGGNWDLQLAAGRYSWYPTDRPWAATDGDYNAGTWTYLGADLTYSKGKWDFGVGYREFRGATPNLLDNRNFNCMDGKNSIKIASAGIGYHFSSAVGIRADYSRVNAGERPLNTFNPTTGVADIWNGTSAPNQKHSYNVRLDWQATKKIGLYVSYKHMSNPGTLASTYDLQSYNLDGQKGWEFGTDISLQKNVSASAYYFTGKNLSNTDKLRMFYGNINFSF
ncbi:MAG: hypothetical protein E7197_04150 [Anaerovibrio sp.]|uniref:S-layer homology domain-containing protein n=1 Tax=Anaerovibrio sp. TaxID=1872532 RepID=UPI0025C5F548|nr:S-layer homology domain-containing protein [Anaerovibrio sp.]MBE6099226.1 hypothetical protein [Anaerovibrio sp.]